jgi:hypothetical protein
MVIEPPGEVNLRPRHLAGVTRRGGHAQQYPNQEEVMANRVQSLAILSLLMILGAGTRAQSPQPTPQDANTKAVTRSKPTEGKVIPPQPVTNLQGFGTKGQIAKFGGRDFLINSLIFESFGGKIGVANNPPGVVKSLNGKTGDLTLQAGSNITITPSGNTLIVSAPTALSGVAHDATLTGNGTTLSPLSVVSAESQREPFHAKGASAFLPTGGLSIDLTTVPADKRLVIEHVTGFCSVVSGDRPFEVRLLFTYQGSPEVISEYLVPSFTGTTGGIRNWDRYTWSQPVRFYADSGARVGLSVVKTIFSADGAGCEGTLSGYLVDKP